MWISGIAFIELFRKIPINETTLSQDKQIVGYISTSMRHEYIRLSKNNNTLTNYDSPIEDIADNISVTYFDCDLIEDRIDIQNIIQKLTPHQKEIVAKIYYENKQDVEIAKELNITKQAIYKQKKGIRKKFQKYGQFS